MVGHMRLFRESFPPVRTCPRGGGNGGLREFFFSCVGPEDDLGQVPGSLMLVDLTNALWFPGFEKPAGAVTKRKSDLAPLLDFLQRGDLLQGPPRPVGGVGAGESSPGHFLVRNK